jgi:hypothetical protein
MSGPPADPVPPAEQPPPPRAVLLYVRRRPDTARPQPASRDRQAAMCAAAAARCGFTVIATYTDRDRATPLDPAGERR